MGVEIFLRPQQQPSNSLQDRFEVGRLVDTLQVLFVNGLDGVPRAGFYS